MSTNSAEVSVGEKTIRKKERPWTDKASIAVGRAAWAGTKFGARASKAVVQGAAKSVWKAKEPLAAAAIAAGGGAAAGDFGRTRDVATSAVDIAGGVLDSGKRGFSGEVIIEGKGKEAESLLSIVFSPHDEQGREDAYRRVAEARVDVNRNFSDEIVKNVYENYEVKLRQVADREQVPFEVLMGMLLWESKGDPNAQSGAGAVGLFQWIEEVAHDEG